MPQLLSALSGLRTRERVVEITASGTWVVPANAQTRLELLAVGGGGGGGGGNTSTSGYIGGQGGSGGQVWENVAWALPGTVLAIVIGQGGTGGLAAANTQAGYGQNGTATTVTATIAGTSRQLISAAGGMGGLPMIAQSTYWTMNVPGLRQAMGGMGGNDTNSSGLPGQDGPLGYGGGGGGGALSSNWTGGPQLGGMGGGGAGGTYNTNSPQPGAANTGGGGGGGAGYSSGTWQQNGGDGGSGLVVITYREVI